MTNRISRAQAADPAYRGLRKLGGAAAFVVVALILSEVVGFTFYGQPAAVSGWFELFQRNNVLGLMDFWGLEVPMYVMFALVYLALYVVLRRASPGGISSPLGGTIV